MSGITIYHNPKCSKSRATLELVEQHGDDVKVVEYLRTPPTAKELEGLLAKLGIEPEQLVRKGEDVYKTLYAGKNLTRAQWIEAMVRHPILIERPIVVSGERAVIGRPPENVCALFERG
jgi:arsenate reductase (glutaredoxin)